MGAHLADFEHCRDFLQMHEVNLLSSQLGMAPLFPLLDSKAVEGILSQLPDEGDLHQHAYPSTLPPGMDEVPGYLAGFAEFDETLLLVEAVPGPTAGDSSPPQAAAATAADVAAAAEAAAAKAVEVLASSQLASPKQKRGRTSAAAEADTVEAGTTAGAAQDASPSKRQRRQASRGVGALIQMEAQLQLDDTGTEADADMPDVPAGSEQGLDSPPQQFVVQQAAAATIAKVAAAARGSPGSRTSQGKKPAFVQQRIASPRKLHYRDFIAPVSTPYEQQLFKQLQDQHVGHNGKVADWTAFTRDWNQAAYQNLLEPMHSRQQLTFKQTSHLLAFDKQLAKSAQQLHTAALSQLGPQNAAAALAAAPVGEQQDVSLQLLQVLSECIQQQGSIDERLPAVLRELYAASLEAQQGASHAAGGSSGAGVEPTASAGPAVDTSGGVAAGVAAAGTTAAAAAAAGAGAAAAGATQQDGAATTQRGAAAAGGSASMADGSSKNKAAAATFAGLFGGRSGAKSVTGGSISKKSGQRTQKGAGTGLGGLGGAKTCIVCTIKKYKLTHPSMVDDAAEPVLMANGHQASCPHCKCKGCRQQWEVKPQPDGSPGVITSWEFYTKAQCPYPKEDKKKKKK
jgi:hypothetical protein